MNTNLNKIFTICSGFHKKNCHASTRLSMKGLFMGISWDPLTLSSFSKGDKEQHPKLLTIVFAVIVLSGLLVGCTDKMAGAGSETTNGVTGCAVSENGAPIADASVKLITAGYNPVRDSAGKDVITAVTGSDGRFRFKKIKPGNYGIIVRHKSNSLCGRISSVEVPAEDSTVNVSECTLAFPGTVVIDFSKTEITSGYCFFPGTDIVSELDSTRKVYLHDVPVGTFDTLVYASADSPDRNLIKSTLTIASQKTVLVGNPGWKNSLTLVLNTASAGIALTKDLFDVPVLLRLNDKNFNFTDVISIPDDLWFGSETGKTVPFEIETWDSANKNAVIWLRIDTLHANSDTQTITMNWENNFPVDSGKIFFTVFDTSCGFQGVWHFSDSAGNNVKDATQNAYYGISPDTARPPQVQGIIGNAFDFDGKKNFISMPSTASGRLNFSRTSSYTISAWVYVAGIDDKSHVIVSKGNTQYFLWTSPIHLSKPLFEFADFRDQSGWDLAVSDEKTGEWVLLTGVHEGTMHKLYVNGVCTDTLIDYPLVLTRSDKSDLMIGRYAQMMASPNNDEGYCFFNGKIDEVQISSVARSAEWIRVMYESQRPDGKLITFKYIVKE